MRNTLSFTKLITLAGLTSAVIGCSVTPDKTMPTSEQAKSFIEIAEKKT